ncbi:Protein of unknown function (DUF1524) [Streptomyces sp. MnatMP-M77]|nr:Protein of unknown function (DUF1524) [Streptomyces sp. MnatMP-M77]
MSGEVGGSKSGGLGAYVVGYLASTWTSYYDGQEVTSAGALDIDHMVPLAEAWDSGASAWTPARREAYANDQGAHVSLVAVTARSNRQKSDQDPADWMPPSPDAQCWYIGEWVSTKLRWQLTADDRELEALKVHADGPCENTPYRLEPGMEYDRSATAPAVRDVDS